LTTNLVVRHFTQHSARIRRGVLLQEKETNYIGSENIAPQQLRKRVRVSLTNPFAFWRGRQKIVGQTFLAWSNGLLFTDAHNL